MLSCSLSLQSIENAVLKVSDEIDKNEGRWVGWREFTEDQLWLELVSCILGSRVIYETSKECMIQLQSEDALKTSKIIREPQAAKNQISKELSKPIYPPFSNNEGRKYPFPKSKSDYIIRTCQEIYVNNSTTLKGILCEGKDEKTVREILIKLCIGIGPKQASLFLRNVGYSENIAILDSHVLRYMDFLGLRDKKNNIYTLKQYTEHESVLLSYANSLNKKMSTLDLAIWIVMRVVQKEFLS